MSRGRVGCRLDPTSTRSTSLGGWSGRASRSRYADASVLLGRGGALAPPRSHLHTFTPHALHINECSGWTIVQPPVEASSRQSYMSPRSSCCFGDAGEPWRGSGHALPMDADGSLDQKVSLLPTSRSRSDSDSIRAECHTPLEPRLSCGKLRAATSSSMAG